MKAVALTAPGEMKVLQIPEPIPQDEDILLKVELVGLCGSDLNSYRGMNPLVSYPRVIGHEIAATVLQGNSEFAPGTQVTVLPYTSCGRCASCRRGRPNACQFNQTYGVQRDGAMTELLSVPAEKVYASSLSLTELCLVEPLTVGMHAVSRARVTKNDVVAVYGCGGVGLGAIAGVAFRGAVTVAIDVDDEKLGIAKACGATHIIHSGRESMHDRLGELTEGLGPDVVIEAVGLPQTFRSAVEEVAFSGRVVYIGYAKEPVSYETRLFVQKELDILGSRNALPEDFKEVMNLLAVGSVPVDRVITSVVSLDDAPEALAWWAAHPASVTKIVVEI
jgi:2-desacetyl-2-hydroxyethyl bacteriochlorophyllide A dehydrogenase